MAVKLLTVVPLQSSRCPSAVERFGDCEAVKQRSSAAAVSCTVSTLEADCEKPVHSCCCRGHCDARTKNSVKLTSETWVKK